MNETLKTIHSRRSYRAFKPEQIRDEELKAILEAAKVAPSAANQQSWHFTVVQNPSLLSKIDQICKAAALNSPIPALKERAQAKDFSIFYHAPTVVIISGDSKAIAPLHDAVLAMSNIFLAAESLGIGSCWIHAVFTQLNSEAGKDVLRELKIPEGYVPQCSAALGYKIADAPARAPRKEQTVTFIK